MDLYSTLLLLLTGALAGTVGSMLGVGGGMIIIPLLTSFFSFDIHHAAGTSHLAVIATSSGVAVAAGRERFTNIRLGLVLAIPTTLCAAIGGHLAGFANASVLFSLFASILVINAVLMWRPDRASHLEPTGDSLINGTGALDGKYRDPLRQRTITYRVKRLSSLLGISAGAGALSGLLGVGGGVLQVPGMNILGGVPMRAATSTSNFLLGMTALSSALVYYGRGDILPIQSAAVVPGVLAGAFAGTAISRRLHSQTLRKLFAFLLVIMAIQMIRKAMQ